MADDYTKLWIQRNLNTLAQTRALEAIEASGLALPCKVVAVEGSIVTVSFEVQNPSTDTSGVTTGGPWTLPATLQIPKAESQWLRAPTQVGDFGLTMPADTFLGGISGLGSGVANLTVQYGNLTCLVFVPVAAVGFSAAPDPNRAWVNGPNGFDASDTAQTGGITYDKATGTLTIYVGTNKIVITADPSVNLIPSSSGGLVGIGALASDLADTQAIASHSDLNTLATGPEGLINQSLVNLMGAMAAAATSTLTGGAAFADIIGAGGFISGISGILPTIPGCSSIAKVAP